MSLPGDDPNADPLADIRALRDRPVPPPGQPLLVPHRLKDILAGHVPDNALVAYPEPTGRVTWTPDTDPIEDMRTMRQRLAECRAHHDNPPEDRSNCPIPHTVPYPPELARLVDHAAELVRRHEARP